MRVKPFKVQVSSAALADLKDRLARTRWPDEIPDTAWDYGTNLAYLRELIDYWQHEFDWSAQERLLNLHPQFLADVHGQGLHFVHVKGKGPNPLPLLISHGWPGSYFEMHKIIGPLSDPGSHGGDPLDAFDIVVPSLPGYGFSEKPTVRGVNIAWIADLFVQLMTDVLGYQTFGAQGGDWGAVITARLGSSYPQHVSGIHLNFVPRFGGPTPPSLKGTEELQAWREEAEYWQREEAAYSRIQGTKPQTLAYGLNDSPVGLAAWIVEKFRGWSDCNGDVESVYTKDELLTNIMIYWVTETINSSARLYYEVAHSRLDELPGGSPVTVPTGVAVFPKEISRPPRTLVEDSYDIKQWTVMEAGGHFAAMERPEELVGDIRRLFRQIRA